MKSVQNMIKFAHTYPGEEKHSFYQFIDLDSLRYFLFVIQHEFSF